MSVSVIIPAAGKGGRFGGKKQFLHYKNKSVLMHAISPFVFCDEINEVIIAVSSDDKNQVNDYLKVANFKKKVSIVEGGLLRQDSVKNAIKCSNKKNQILKIGLGEISINVGFPYFFPRGCNSAEALCLRACRSCPEQTIQIKS